MKLKNIMIVGRPNVGKSSLFNAILKDDRSIVDKFCGVTRDIVTSKVIFAEKEFTIMDSAGIYENMEDEIDVQSQERAKKIINDVDGIVFVVDGKDGVMPDDHKIAKMIYKSGRKAMLVINKCDHKRTDSHLGDFSTLGFDDGISVSAANRRNINGLLEEIIILFDITNLESTSDSKDINIAIIGKPNVGKSSLINKLARDDISVVSSTPGTTRDSVDVKIKHGGRNYVFIDTAGIRPARGRTRKTIIEVAGIEKSVESIDRANVVLLIVDGFEGLCARDKKIFNLIKKSNKPIIIVMNKWDLVRLKKTELAAKYIDDTFKFLSKYPKIFISTKKLDINKIYDNINTATVNSSKRVSTSVLNSFIKKITKEHKPGRMYNKIFNIYYATQTSTSPPEFVLFANNSSLVSGEYMRFIEKRLSDEFGFDGIPIAIKIKNKEKRYGK
ncbi:MAG: ribosome biogenesis GTPase Der [Chlamydiia bacterium]|nr:ribosome biogenesis GTPase Der [Chlamydiia bacterium]